MMTKRDAFACFNGATGEVKKPNLNEHITQHLEKLQQRAKSQGDHWRAYTNQKALTTLRNLPFRVENAAQVRGKLGIGEKTAQKIQEILDTGHLRRADFTDEHTQTFELFSKIWGAGPETIKKWYAAGFRTLEDLRRSGDLTRQQEIGLRFYDDLQQRIPRAEVEKMEHYLLKTARSISPDILMVVCGSYRRGRADCGDMDCLFTNKKGSSLDGFLVELVQRLTEAGFLIADLILEPRGGKYFGVSRLPGRPARRIDFQIIDVESWPFALLYFTGSDHFNRSMRLWARKNGFSLSERSLTKRLGGDLKSTPIPGIHSEEDIFTALGLKYLPPEQRNV
jgi:DNA polymerase lambda